MIDQLVAAGFSVKQCCRVLGVSSAGYYMYRKRPLSPTKMRREWLTALIKEVHAESRGTYGARRVHAELTKGRGIHVSANLVAILMHNAGIAGLPGPAKTKRVKGRPTSDDLVKRQFTRSDTDELWVSDITEHPTREGKVYCCCVLDTSAGASSAGRSTRSKTPRLSSTLSTWRSSSARRSPAASSMLITALSSPPGPSLSGSGRQG